MRLRSPALALMILAAVTLYGCGSPAQERQPSSVLRPAPTHTSTTLGSRSDIETVAPAPETPTIAPVRSTPMPITKRDKTSPRYQGPEPFEIFPDSPRASLGKPYPFLLNVHCGLDFEVNFDSSFWKLDERREVPEDYLGGGVPELEGTMTLIAPHRARFDFDPASIYTNLPSSRASVFFVRHDGRKILDHPCM